MPLWIALILRNQGKCNIVAPNWLTVDYLKEKYDEELKFPDMFSDLPWNWIELSKILLTKALEDLPDSSTQLRSLIQDLREVRLLKSRRGLRELNESNIQLNGISLMEINELRPFILSVMGKLGQLHDSVAEEDDNDGSDLE